MVSSLLPDAFWDDVPILHTPIPYADYQAQGSYGRILNLAEDVPPTTSVLVGHERQSNGALVPHLVNTDASGNLLFNPAAGTEKVEVLLSDGTPVDSTHPFPVTSGGGGGGNAPVTLKQVHGESVNVGGVGGPVAVVGLNGTPTAIYGVTVGWFYSYSPGNALPLGNLRFYLSNSTETLVIDVARFAVSRNNFTADNGPPWITGEEQNIWFPFPIAAASWPDASALQLRANGDIINVSVSGTVLYTV